jgi:ferredoxin-NADP reductase
MPDVLIATITHSEALSEHVREITLKPENGPVTYTPGQWLSLRLPVGDRPPLVRAYSLATAPTADGTLTICFDRVEAGLGSGYLWEAELGTPVEFAGPLGNFALPEGDGPLVLAARYTGIVPFRAMLQAIEAGQAPQRPVHLIYGAPSVEEQVYHAELEALAGRVDWLEYHPTTEPDGDLALLQAHATHWMPFSPLLCGVREFTFPARAFLMETLGLERRAVKVENYNGPTAR